MAFVICCVDLVDRIRRRMSIKEKKNLDDALKNDLNAALKEFQQHFKSMKAPAGAA